MVDDANYLLGPAYANSLAVPEVRGSLMGATRTDILMSYKLAVSLCTARMATHNEDEDAEV